MKRLSIICAFISLAVICEGQGLNYSSYSITPLEKEAYKKAVSKGRGQKALGSLIILGGSGLTALGARVAIAGLNGSIDDDIFGEEVYDRDDLLWKGGSALFLLGLGTISIGADMIKEGKQNVRSGKVSLRVNRSSVGLAVNF
jgi:hypothetical protein